MANDVAFDVPVTNPLQSTQLEPLVRPQNLSDRACKLSLRWTD